MNNIQALPLNHWLLLVLYPRRWKLRAERLLFGWLLWAREYKPVSCYYSEQSLWSTKQQFFKTLKNISSKSGQRYKLSVLLLTVTIVLLRIKKSYYSPFHLWCSKCIENGHSVSSSWIYLWRHKKTHLWFVAQYCPLTVRIEIRYWCRENKRKCPH